MTNSFFAKAPFNAGKKRFFAESRLLAIYGYKPALNKGYIEKLWRYFPPSSIEEQAIWQINFAHACTPARPNTALRQNPSASTLHSRPFVAERVGTGQSISRETTVVACNVATGVG